MNKSMFLIKINDIISILLIPVVFLLRRFATELVAGISPKLHVFMYICMKHLLYVACTVDQKKEKTSMLWPSQNFLLYKCSTLI